MPGRNGTGPEGNGPATGRKMGKCRPKNDNIETLQDNENLSGSGRGRNGTGLGGGRRGGGRGMRGGGKGRRF